MRAVGWIALFALGLYPLFGGRFVIRRVTRGLADACANCGYAFAGETHEHCPECGSKAR